MSNCIVLTLCILLSLSVASCGESGTAANPMSDASTDTNPTNPVSNAATATNPVSNVGSTGSQSTSSNSGTQGAGTSTDVSIGNVDTGGTTADDSTTETTQNTNNSTEFDVGTETIGSDMGTFGLTERASLADLNLPIDGVQTGGYQLVNAFPNLNFEEALLVSFVPGENRVVVVEQFGKIKVFNDDPAVTSSSVILDYTNEISVTSGEQGLLGFVFDPDFVENRFVYIYHTQVVTNRSILTRLYWDRSTDMLDRSTAKVVMQIEQPYESHNGGNLLFGADNFLYIGLGDGGDGGDPHNNAQDTSTLLGSILRIDVHPTDDSVGYAIPESNPHVGQTGVRPEIYAHGFRNPWRFSFDRATNEMWLGDVGQENREEINLVKAGGNYGWRVFEGTRPQEAGLNSLPDSAFTPPIYEYTHDIGLAVIGGYVYRGSVSALQGRYLFSDFANGEITALTLDGEVVTSVDVIASVEAPTSFGETLDGEILVVSRYGGIFKFVENASSVEFPEKLSETGLFTDLASLVPASGLIEYAPNHPFWSDGTIKRRWIGIPDDAKIDFTDNDWSFPLGSVSVKHFEVDMIENTPGSRRRLESRVMYHTVQGWQGYTYRWNIDQNEAHRISDRESEQLSVSLNDGSTREQQYDYPGRADCGVCHNEASTHLLGLETGQLNASFDYLSVTDNQLRSFNNIGLFSYDIGPADQYKVLPQLNDEGVSIEKRARAYLDVNCSTCHQPRGPAPTGMDFRFEIANSGLKAIDVWPQSGSFGVSDPRIIAPGSKERSILWQRMRLLDDGRMPPISTHVVDEAAVRLIGEWIDSL